MYIGVRFRKYCQIFEIWPGGYICDPPKYQIYPPHREWFFEKNWNFFQIYTSIESALKGRICLSENLLTVIRTNLRVMGTGFPQLRGWALVDAGKGPAIRPPAMHLCLALLHTESTRKNLILLDLPWRLELHTVFGYWTTLLNSVENDWIQFPIQK